MHFVKLLHQNLSAQNFGRQVADVQVRAEIQDGSTAIGIPETEGEG
mgnify:CR=1 FL=1